MAAPPLGTVQPKVSPTVNVTGPDDGPGAGAGAVPVALGAGAGACVGAGTGLVFGGKPFLLG